MRTPAKNCIVVSCAVLLGAGLVAQWRLRAVEVSGSKATRVVTISGERLQTLFEGLSPAARYEWKKISAQTTRGRVNCKTKAQTSRLERILVALGVETVAYAQYCFCPTEPCAGEYECYDSTECDPCYGIVENPDFQCGPENQGEDEDGTGCIQCLCGLCDRPLCRD